MTSTTFEFGTWIQKIRKSLQLTRQQVSQRANGLISPQYIHFIETGKNTNIGSDKLVALAQGLGIPVAILNQGLFEGKEPEIPLVGRVAAGPQIALCTEEYQQESFPYFSTRSNLYAVEIIGDSMAPKLEHGDWAMVEPSLPGATIQPGWIYLIAQAKRVTCKYIMEYPETPGSYWLVAEQEHLFAKTQLTPQHQVLGKIVEVRKANSLYRPS